MIVCVALNPLLDKICTYKNITMDEHNSIIDQNINIGGTEIEAIRTIKLLQGEPNAIGFLGGLNGRYIKNFLDKNRIKSDFLWVNGETTLNTTYIDLTNNNTIKFHEKGIIIQEKDILRLKRNFEMSIKDSSVILLNTSLSKEFNNKVFQEMIATAKRYNIKTVLHTSGESLVEGIKAQPYSVVLERENLKELNIKEENSQKILEKVHELLVKNSIHYIALNLYDDALYTISKNKICKVSIDNKYNFIKSEIGMSAFIGAFALCIERKYEIEKTTKISMAASSAAAKNFDTDILFKKSEVDYSAKKYKIKEIMNKNNM